MFKNYLRTAVRNLRKHGFYSVINIVGLAIGLTACVLIAFWVVDELSYDRYHPYADRTYRIWLDGSIGGNEVKGTISPPPLAAALQEDFPEVETVFRFRSYGTEMVHLGERTFKEEHFIYADSTLFEVFGLQLLAGDAQQALAEPRSLVISRHTAERYFGKNWTPESLLGTTVRLNDQEEPYRLTGVVENVRSDTHFHFDLFCSLTTSDEARNGEWTTNNFQTYLVLRPDADPAALATKWQPVIDAYITPQLKAFFGDQLYV